MRATWSGVNCAHSMPAIVRCMAGGASIASETSHKGSWRGKKLLKTAKNVSQQAKSVGSLVRSPFPAQGAPLAMLCCTAITPPIKEFT